MYTLCITKDMPMIDYLKTYMGLIYEFLPNLPLAGHQGANTRRTQPPGPGNGKAGQD